MNPRLIVGLSSLLVLTVAVGCSDRAIPTSPIAARGSQRTIVDGVRGGDLNFLWLTPTVAVEPAHTGPFDDGALDQLVIEVCQLDAAGACTGPLVEQMTSSGNPVPSRIKIDTQNEFYTVNWMTGRSHVDAGLFYRARVLRNGTELGSLDVSVVKNTPAMSSVNPALFVGVVNGQQLELRFRIQKPTARTHVKINEVESSGGVPGDWIELYNTANVPLSLAGYIVKDNDDTHVYTLPADASIPPGGFYVVEEANLGFGLGAADAARFYTPDGSFLIDSYSWTAHAVTTYGRCPDGSGAFQTTTVVTKGAANDCSIIVRINEVESSGGVPGDWVELYNAGPVAANIGGYVFKDNDDTHIYTIPAGTTIAAGGYLTLEEAQFGFGLGAPDAARLFRPNGTLADSYSWTSHATATYARCPNATGAFTTSTSVTKGAANDCGNPVKINEIESSGGTPGDWVELYNPTPNPVNLAGLIFRDNDDTHTYVIPAGSVIPGNGYFVLEEEAFGFGLGAPDAARLFAPDGTTLLDSFSWMTHAATTYGRCPDGSAGFVTTAAPTKGTANSCTGQTTVLPWPGDPDIAIVDGSNVFGGNLSGLIYEGSGSATPGVLWGARNGVGSLFRLLWNGTIWTPDAANSWGAGKALHYPDGTGDPDAEGVTFAGAGSAGGMYVSTERNNSVSGTSRNSILRFDPSGAGASLTATNEWNLTSDLPATGANLGAEGVTWVPDAFLTSHGFFDETKGHVYNPAEYANHAGGLFFVGLEANGMIYAYALNDGDNAFTRIATFTSSFAAVMDLSFDREFGEFWAVCDDGCGGHHALLAIDTRPGLPTSGRFIVTNVFARPAGMDNLNNEGFAITPQAECVNGKKPVFWADDTEDGGHAIRRGMLTCTPFF